MVSGWKRCTAAVFAAMLLAGGLGNAAAQGRQGPPSQQPRGSGGPPPGHGGPGGPGGPMADDEMRKAMEAVMRTRLKETLQMTPEQEARVMPKVEKLQDARHDFAGRRRKAVSHLRAVMMDETSTPADLDKALKEVRSLETAFRQREETLRAELDAELEPRQQARLYFFEERFRREMQRRLMEGGGPRGPGGPGRGPGPGAGPGGATGPDGGDEPEGGDGPDGPPPDEPGSGGGGEL